MKKVNILGGLFGVLMIIGAISCKSAPPPVEEPSAPVQPTQPVQPAPPARDPNLAPPDQAALDALAAVKTRAEEARKRAFDFGGPDYTAKDWEAAEAQYATAGEEEKTETLGDVKEAVARYEQAALAFDEVFNRALPLYAEALKNDILQARAAALEAGIADFSPDYLQKADDTANKALAFYEAKDYYPAADTGYMALDMFRSLKVGADTYGVWREVEDYGFGKYDLDNYDAANKAALAALDGYDALPDDDTVNIKDVLGYAEEAQYGYIMLLANGWRIYATERQAAAGAERQVALDLKANVAVRDDYGAAQALFANAEISFRARRYPEAAEQYFQAEFLFASAAGTAAEKRRLAEEAIQEAKEKSAASEETARRAETVLGGGTE